MSIFIHTGLAVPQAYYMSMWLSVQILMMQLFKPWLTGNIVLTFLLRIGLLVFLLLIDYSLLRTVPPFVTAQMFCASRDIQVS